MSRTKTQKQDEFFPNGLVFDSLSESQDIALREFTADKNLVLTGYAGTGKTYVAMHFALQSIREKGTKTIKIIRSAVPGRDIGFLPGSESEKLRAYESPYRSTVNTILQNGSLYDIMKSKGIIGLESTSYLRSQTFDDTFIVVDEIQNMTFQELYSVITRVGDNSRIIFCGDTHQCDLIREYSGFEKFLSILKKMPRHFSFIQMPADDIVRSNIVRDFIIASETI